MLHFFSFFFFSLTEPGQMVIILTFKSGSLREAVSLDQQPLLQGRLSAIFTESHPAKQMGKYYMFSTLLRKQVYFNCQVLIMFFVAMTQT